MSTYLFELPTTGAVSFADFCSDDGVSYITHIAEATEARANLRVALKESKRTDEKDHLRLVKVLDDYLPQLCGIMACIEHGELVLKSEPIFSWRTTLSANLFHSSPRVSLPALPTELAFTLLTYAFALSNLARAVVHSLGNYERERGTSDVDRKAKDERLSFATTLLCKAAGVFEYIARDVLPVCDRERARLATTGISSPKPPDLSKEVVVALSKMALADAQTIAIRKLLTRAAFDNTVAPGPPLPKSHPAPALVAKLHLECAALYASARSLAMTPGSTRSPSGSKPKLHIPFGKDKNKDPSKNSREDTDEVVPELRRYLADENAFHSALARKWLGVDAGEAGGTSKGGIAVGFLAGAKHDLEDLKGRSGGAVATDREKEMREQRRAKVSEELQNVNVFYTGYKNMNDSMGFQPVPPQSELQAQIPAGRSAVSVRPYTRPTPAFGPGSVEYVRRQAEELELGDEEPPLPADVANSRAGTYAGEGAYF